MHDMTGHEGEISAFAAQADAYQLLSLFLHLPTLELAAGLLNGLLADDVEQLLFELGVAREQSESVAVVFRDVAAQDLGPGEYLRVLRTEYTRLLTHPTRSVLSPYEAVFLYREGRRGKERPLLFTNPAALDAERLYHRAGLARCADVNESGDHFATQLEFASFLYRKQISLLEGGKEALSSNQAILDEFTDRHLAQWVEPFFTRMAAEAQEPAYRALARFGLLSCCGG